MKNYYKTLRSALGMFLGTLIVSNSFSQTVDVQIGTGTGTNGEIPINNNWGYTYSQQIYTAADLNAAGITGPATISKIRFYRTSGNLNSATEWVVYLGNSSKTSFTSTTDWESIANLQQVFSGTITAAATNAWQEIEFTTPFAWDGTSNLIVAVDENQGGYGGVTNWQVSNLGGNRAIYYRSDSNNPNPASPPTATGRIGSVNNIQIVATPSNSCNGVPTLTDIISSTGADACENENFNLTLQNGNSLYFLDGITYQWQSFDGTNWNDIAGATNNNLPVTANLGESEYQVVIGCSHTADETILAPISINVNTAPTVSVDVQANVICTASSIAITASGATTYAWSPATGLSATNTATVNASPTNSTVYTVTGTDANGCTATAQSAITTYATVATETTTNPTEICEANSPVTVEIVTPASVQGGNWEYRFLNVDGTQAQPWNTTNTFNFIPTMDSVYTYYAQIRNSACGNALDSVKTNVVVGFGGDVSQVDYDCNNLGGTINVTNAFGQVETTTLYQNAFSTTSDATGVAMTGTAAITGGRLVLTPSAMSSSGAASFDGTSNLGSNNSMNVSFLMTMDTPIDVGADGLAYSFGNDVLTGSAPLQNGRGTKLRLSFDAIDNSTSNGNITGVYLVYGWTNTTTSYGPTSNGVLAFNPSTAAWFNKTDVLVNLTIDASGKANVTVDGQVIFSNVQMPADYMNADVSNWKHHFGAQTGGFAFRQAVSNMNISAGSVTYGISQGTATTEPTDWQANGTFTDLAPGTYHVWLAKDSTAVCSKNIQTIEILNTNPVINLGADTTICAGETLVLDAGNPGATYVWSGTNIVTQTLEVTNAGTYTAYATAANGCFGVGNINVSVSDVPSATGIYRQGSYPNFTYTVLNANNADSYDWNFGDGTTLTNAPSTVNHYYTSSASVTVTATLSNDCGSTTVSQIYGDLSIASNELEGLEMYPNPASGQFTVSLIGSNDATVTVISTTGAIVLSQTEFTDKLTVNTNQWESGIYFVTVSNNGIASTQKLIVK